MYVCIQGCFREGGEEGSDPDGHSISHGNHSFHSSRGGQHP